MELSTALRAPRTEPLAARLAPVIGGACVLLAAAGLASFVVRGAPFSEYYEAWIPHNAPTALIGGVVFALALRRQPHNRAVRALLGASLASAVHVAAVGAYAVRLDALPPTRAAAIRSEAVAVRDLGLDLAVPLWILSAAWVLSAGLLIAAFLFFPDGRLPSRRWRGAWWLTQAGIVTATAAWAWNGRPWSAHPMTFGSMMGEVDAVGGALFAVGMPLLGVASLVAVASQVVRLRSADAEQRRRVRPAVVTFGLGGVAVVLLYPWPPLWAAATAVAVSLLVVVLAAGVVRSRLFDVDVVLTRAVALAVLGAVVTLAYVGIVAGLGALLGTRADLWWSVAATAVIAVGFDPLRRRVTALANRLVTGAQVPAAEVLASLSDRLARADSTDEVLARVVDLLRDGTGATRVEVRARTADGWRPVAAAGDALADPAVRAAPVTNTGDLLGEVRLLAPRDDHLLPGDERLLAQVAATLGPVLRNADLTRDLRQHIADLQDSRRRLVTAQDDARRRLERDLHDGAQQQLVSVRIKLGLAATLAERGRTDDLAGLVGAIADETDAAIHQLRRLAQGLYPPVLEEGGLAAALEARAAEHPLPVTVTADGVGRYDRSVEAAVYFCCLEALQNALKHANASALRVELAGVDGELRFAVADDGDGFDPVAARDGMGMTNLRDRVSGLGGELDVESRPGAGTVVRGRVPVAVGAS